MRLSGLDGVSLGVVAVTVLAGLAALPALPGEVAIQFDLAGSPTTTVAAPLGVAVLPGVTVVVLGSLRGGPLFGGGHRVGPLAALAVVAGLAWLQGVILAWNLGVLADPRPAVVPAVLVILGGSLYGRTATGT